MSSDPLMPEDSLMCFEMPQYKHRSTNNSANFLIHLRCIVTSSNHKTCKESDIWQNRCVQKRTLFPQKMQNAFPLMISTVRVFLTSPTKLRETDASIRKVRQNKSPREFYAKTQKSNQINLFPIHRSNPNNCAPDTLVIDKSTLTRVGDAKPKVVGNHWRSHNMRYQFQFRFLVSESDYISSIYVPMQYWQSTSCERISNSANSVM